MAAVTRNMSNADEVREVPNGRIEIVNMAGQTIGRTVFQPGWKWSNDVKPVAKTDLCEFEHLGYIMSGQIKVVMKDGSETTAGPGDVVSIPAGHDAWVVGNEAVTMIDFMGTDSDYAKPQ
jgi:mannose-6-phosphate isomerase-like protein (cupin superfamily)